MPVSQSLTLNRPLVNHDRLRWVTRYNTFNLQGSGRVENLGLWELYKDPLNGFGYESIVGVPVNVPAGGKLLLSTNALVVFTQPSSLTVAGELEIQQGARLRLDGSAPARDLTLLPGSQLSGAGTLRLEGANRIALEGSITSGIGLLEMSGSSSISGAFTLTVASGSTLRFDHSSTIPGSITVEGTLTLTSPSVVVTINGRLTLNAGGVLNNPGTIRVGIGEFINNGGTINGTPPQDLAGTSVPLQISGISITETPSTTLAKARQNGHARELVISISWSGRRGPSYAIETSADLVHWAVVAGTITEVASGSYQGRMTMPLDSFHSPLAVIRGGGFGGKNRQKPVPVTKVGLDSPRHGFTTAADRSAEGRFAFVLSDAARAARHNPAPAQPRLLVGARNRHGR
jgi:hypothetical protein